MRNWKTTLAGLLAAVFTALATGVMETGDWRAIGLTVALAVFGFVAKDRNVSTADPEAIAAAVADILRRPEREDLLPAADRGLSAGAEDDSFRDLARSMPRRKPETGRSIAQAFAGADHCTYPDCTCPFDHTGEKDWCAVGLPQKQV